MARVVASDAEADRKAEAKATAKVDRRLRKAEREIVVVKAGKPKVRKVRSRGAVAEIEKALRLTPGLASFLNSDDPAEREMARSYVGL
jgi:hypothetical protein